MLNDKEQAAFDAITQGLDFSGMEKKALAERKRPRRIFWALFIVGLGGTVATFTTSPLLALATLVVAGAGLYGLLQAGLARWHRGERSGVVGDVPGRRGVVGWLTKNGILQDLSWETGRSRGVHHYGALVFSGAARPGTKQWCHAVGLLSQYVKRAGNALVPKEHIESGFALGQWVILVRVARKLGDLTDEQVRELDALGMAWGVDA